VVDNSSQALNRIQITYFYRFYPQFDDVHTVTAIIITYYHLHCLHCDT